MGKKILTLAFLSILLLAGACVPAVSATSTIAREDIFIFADVAGPETTDPAWAYDKASYKLIMNVYETLIWYEVDRTLPPEQQRKMDEFVPALATSWTVTQDGLNWTFTIREGVKWHDPAYGTLTTEDVEYSFERAMLQDRSSGPAWLLMYILLGRTSVPHPPDYTNEAAEAFAHALDDAVTSTDTTVTFHCAKPYGVIFLQILASFGFVVNRDWCVSLNDWPGFDVTGYTWAGWQAWHDPLSSPIDAAGSPMMGTGPYKLDWLTMGVEWSIVAHGDYWGGWPSPISDGYFHRATLKVIKEWSVRKAGFLAGDYDSVYVPGPHVPELVVYKDPVTGEETYPEGIRCYKDLPVFEEYNVFFNYNTSTRSWCLGPEFNPEDPYAFGEYKTPVHFFQDHDLRHAFALSFDYDTFIKEAFLGEAMHPATHHVKGLAYYDPPPPEGTGPEPYPYNPTGPWSAEYYFKMAWGGVDANSNGIIDPVNEPGDAYGLVWKEGFTMTIPLHGYYEEEGAAAEVLKTVVEALHPEGKFHIDVLEDLVDFPPFYMWALLARELPLFILCWIADFLHPQGFAHPYMHTDGTIAYCQSMEYLPGVDEIIEIPEIEWSGTSDQLITDAAVELDTARAEVMYRKLQEIFHDRVINMPISQPTERHWEREWIKGWYFNTLYPNTLYYYARPPLSTTTIYHYWRRIAADLNYDGVANILDKWILNANWGPLFTPEKLHYNYRADINNDGIVSIVDKGIMNMQWGLTGPVLKPEKE